LYCGKLFDVVSNEVEARRICRTGNPGFLWVLHGGLSSLILKKNQMPLTNELVKGYLSIYKVLLTGWHHNCMNNINIVCVETSGK